MRDADCVAFLRWALPRLGFRWQGFRRVRRQVCRRIASRSAELGLPDVGAYRQAGSFHLVLCRNLAFTYFAEPLQREVVDRIRGRLLPGGALVIGGQERLPALLPDLAPWRRSVWRWCGCSTRRSI